MRGNVSKTQTRGAALDGQDAGASRPYPCAIAMSGIPWLIALGGLVACGAVHAAGFLQIETQLARAMPAAMTDAASRAAPDPGLRLAPAYGLIPPSPPAAGSPDTVRHLLLYEAVSLHRQGRFDEAEAAYRQAIGQPDPPPAAHLGLARLLARRAGAAAAAALLEQAHGLTPDPALAAEAGRWWAAAGEVARAIDWLLRGADQLTGTDWAWLAAAHLRAGRPDEAALAYRRALEETERAIWWLGLAHALEALGEASAASEAYRRALALPGLPPEAAAYARQRLAEG